MREQTLTRVELPGFEWQSGKVRDRALIPGSGLIFVTTDRISAFDVILPTPVPQKGRILNQLSIFWKRFFTSVIPNDLINWEPEVWTRILSLSPEDDLVPVLIGRTVLAKKAEMIPVECVVRGYLAGSLWQEYLKIRGKEPTSFPIQIHDLSLPGNLKEADELPLPIFTPATKAVTGHDENISFNKMVEVLSNWLARHPTITSWKAFRLTQLLQMTSLAIYTMARQFALKRGIIIADTKFEFGISEGAVVLADEVLTPDSSRFWPLDSYCPGRSQPSFDKQPVRDYLVASGWNRQPPAPELPTEVVEATTERYSEAFQRLTDGGALL